MRIVETYPPNFAAIDAKFGVLGKPCLYAYGGTIYNPLCVAVTPALTAHEEVHSERQRLVGVEAWWLRYIEEDIFRLDEEVLAHAAEARRLIQDTDGSDRARRLVLSQTSTRLASPLYKYGISARSAHVLLREKV
jgi:hypothetical protein